MTRQISTNSKEPATVAANNREDIQRALLRLAGGSQFNEWNALLVAHTANALTADDADASERAAKLDAILHGLAGFGSRDALEAMMAAKLVVAHGVEMDCYRLAKNARNPDKRSDQLKLAIRLSRASATLLDALDRHRGKE